jgi:hypothetical protein
MKFFRTPDMDGQVQDPNQQLADEENPETTVENQDNAEPEIVASKEWYDDINRRMTEENYQPTDAELEAGENYKHGQAPETAVKTEEGTKPEVDETATKPAATEPSSNTEGVDDNKPAATTPTMEDTLKLVGAKEPTELHGKVMGLINHFREEGGKRGQELKDVTTARDEAVSLNKEMGTLLIGLQSGDQTAINDLFSLGADIKANIAKALNLTETPANTELEIPSEVVDDATYKYAQQQNAELRGQIGELTQMVKTLSSNTQGIQTSIQEREQAATAAAQQETKLNDLIGRTRDLITKNPTLLPEGANVDALLEEYYRGDPSQPFSGAFQEVHKILKFSDTKGLGTDLETAKRLHDIETGVFTQQLIDAEAKGRESAMQTNLQPGMSEVRQQGGGNEVNSSYSEVEVEEMAAGRKPIPDEWLDEDDNLKPYDQLPEVAKVVSQRMRATRNFV